MTEKRFSFKFGTRKIQATGHEADYGHPTVLMLRIDKSLINTIIWAILPLLPQFIYLYMKTRWPEWILPEHIVMKRHKGDDWEQEFEDEIRFYNQLSPLQGYRIPEFYGRFEYLGSDAILVSRIFGQEISAFGDSPFPRGEPELYMYLREAYEDIGKFGLYHGDNLFANFLLVDDSRGKRIMVLDLERMWDFSLSRLSDPKFLSDRCRHAMEMDRFRCFPMGVPEGLRWRKMQSSYSPEGK